jgi:hypothetical protein
MSFWIVTDPLFQHNIMFIFIYKLELICCLLCVIVTTTTPLCQLSIPLPTPQVFAKWYNSFRNILRILNCIDIGKVF